MCETNGCREQSECQRKHMVDKLNPQAVIEPNSAAMTANMKLLGWGRSIRASSLRGLQGRSATGQNSQAPKEKMSWRAGCRENTSGFQLMEKCFSLDITFIDFRLADDLPGTLATWTAS